MDTVGMRLDEQDKHGNSLRGAKMFLEGKGITDEMALRMIEVVSKGGSAGPNENEVMRDLRTMINNAKKPEKNGIQ